MLPGRTWHTGGENSQETAKHTHTHTKWNTPTTHSDSSNSHKLLLELNANGFRTVQWSKKLSFLDRSGSYDWIGWTTMTQNSGVCGQWKTDGESSSTSEGINILLRHGIGIQFKWQNPSLKQWFLNPPIPDLSANSEGFVETLNCNTKPTVWGWFLMWTILV